MRRHKYLRPYVRRANGTERASGLRMGIRLAFYQLRGRPFYVLIQHGSREVMDVGSSKAVLKQSPVPVRVKKKSFRKWAKDVQRLALGNYPGRNKQITKNFPLGTAHV